MFLDMPFMYGIVAVVEKFNTNPSVILLITGSVRTSVRLFALP